MFCKNCGKELKDKAVACMACGMNPRNGKEHCYTCGEAIKDKQIVCTKCGANLEESFISSPLTKRFLISFAWTFSLFILLIILTQPKSQWFYGFVGSGMFALLSGVIGMVIRSERKIIYVPVTMIIAFAIALAIGLSMK
jgi:predicted nucleic acid-binding Zn ribbon protein